MQKPENRTRVFAIVMFLLLLTTGAWAQTGLQKTVILNLQEVSIQRFFVEMRQQTGLNFIISSQDENKVPRITVKAQKETAKNVLDRVFGKCGCTYTVKGKLVTVVYREQPATVQRRIYGVVKDDDGNTVPGVTLKVEGTKVMSVTDENGAYSLKVPSPCRVTFSYIGAEDYALNVPKSEKALNRDVQLKTGLKIDEVVVNGYQAIKKKAMVGAYSQISSKDLNMSGTQNLETMLQGKIAGMVVTNQSGQVGTRQKIRIRGTSTLVGNAEPVWVVDGIIQEDNLPFESSTLAAMGNNLDMMRDYIGSSISWLNPHDIDNITVLKDAAATAIYGTKAANGVILITTKKGQRGRMSISYSGSFSTSRKLRYKDMELMNSQDRVLLSQEALERGARVPAETVGYTGLVLKYLNREISEEELAQQARYFERVNTDWLDILSRSPFNQSHSVSMSGGNDNATYRASFGYNKTQNTVKGNDRESFSGSLTTTMSFWKKLNITASVSGSHAKTNAFASGMDPYNYAMTTSRAIPCYNEDGSLYYYDSDNYNYNILNELANSGNKNTLNSINANMSARYHVTDEIFLTAQAGGSISQSDAETWFTEHSNYIAKIRGYNYGQYDILDEQYKRSPLPHGGMLSTSSSRNVNWTARFQAEWIKTFNKLHNVSLVGGVEARSSKYDGLSQTNWGYMPERGKTFTDVPLTYGDVNQNNEYARTTPSVTDRRSNTVSYYATASYMFDQRYAVNVNVRGDASNRLGEKQRFLPVWSAGARWNITDEHWMEKQQVFDELSMTLDFGYQGNVADNISPDLITRINALNAAGEYTMSISQLPNPHLKWEKTLSINYGLNFALFGNKLNGSFNYYFKKSMDLITTAKVPMYNGTQTMRVNNGNMYNRGWDLTLSITPIRTKDFMWTLGTTFSGNDNEVSTQIPESGDWTHAVNGTLYKKGYPVGAFWAFRYTGLDHETGAPTFDFSRAATQAAEEDATEYMQYMGTREPTFTIGINNVFRYKRWSIPISFYVSRGNYEFLSSPYTDPTMMISEYNNASTQLNDRWRQPGDELHTDIPSIPVGANCRRLYPFQSTSDYIYPLQAWQYSNLRVVNAWYIRFNDFTFTYHVPEKYLKGICQSASISFMATNPIQIKSKDFKGRDPEVALGSQPRSKDVSVSVNVSF